MPPDVVRRRFVRSVYNFFHFYIPLLDSWRLFDNSADLPRLIADEESGSLTVITNLSQSKVITKIQDQRYLGRHV